jgi:hypothetical protein
LEFVSVIADDGGLVCATAAKIARKKTETIPILFIVRPDFVFFAPVRQTQAVKMTRCN